VLIYIGVDEFNAFENSTLLHDIVLKLGEVMSRPPPQTFVVGMLTGTASEALTKAFDSSKHRSMGLPAPLLSREQQELVVDGVAELAAADWRSSKGFRRCLAGQH
jgi:hypothetical protein